MRSELAKSMLDATTAAEKLIVKLDAIAQLGKPKSKHKGQKHRNPK